MQLSPAPARRAPLCVSGAVALGLALWLAPGLASAYPQFQFSKTANRCSMCHFAPAGGGLINAYGRAQSSRAISQLGGDGSALHGLYDEPDWFKIGGDYRTAFLVRDAPEDGEVLFFPMQAELYARAEAGSAWSLNIIAGVRGQAREPRRSAVSRFISREHFVMWQPKNLGPYVRAGRFMAPYGIRTQDHTAYVRRYLGFHTHEETYNVSGGWIERDWEIHATGFAPVPPILAGNGPGEGGLALYYEHRPLGGRRIALGAQARAGLADVHSRYFLGGVGKLWFEPASLLLMGEINLGAQTFDVGPTRSQLASYLGLTYFPAKGFMLGAIAERYDQDLSVSGTYRDGYSVTFQYFPYAHFELMLIGKVELHGGYDRAVRMLMLQGHYYL